MVFRYKLVPYEYFLDRLGIYEINDLIGGIEYVDREEWERMRILSFFSVAPYCKMDMKEMLPFSWDDKSDMGQKDTTITNDDIKRLKAQAQQFSDKYLNRH